LALIAPARSLPVLALAVALLTVFSSAFSYVHNLLPEVVPVYYGLSYAPDRWGTKDGLVACNSSS